MTLSSFIQIFIAVIFIISALSKLFDLKSFRATIEEIGIKRPLLALGTIIVPVLELIISVLLFWKDGLVIGLILLSVLLITFFGSTLRSFSMRKKIKCNCFGAITDESLGWSTIVKIPLIAILGIYLILDLPSKSIWEYPILDVIYSVFISISFLLLYSMLQILTKERKHQLKSEGE